MSKLIGINELFDLNKKIPLTDVRSPAEFENGHIPGAINIPLFDNEERAIVGTLYKNSGQKEAILTGLDIAGKKMRGLAEAGLKIAKNKKLIVHCWRGGMRSSSMAWLFETAGISCHVLSGGYKAYRSYIHEYFDLPFNLLIIGGMTGSGKSEILDELENLGYQVLKLEKVAHHKGSAFGNLGEQAQNSNEQFENDLFTTLQGFDKRQPIFVEDESFNIGRNIIPAGFFKSMSSGRLILIEMDKKLRLGRLVKEYGTFGKQELKDSVLKIAKRIGGANTQKATVSIDEGNLEEAADICLSYYDKAYNYGLSKKINSEIIRIHMESADAKTNVINILNVLKSMEII